MFRIILNPSSAATSQTTAAGANGPHSSPGVDNTHDVFFAHHEQFFAAIAELLKEEGAKVISGPILCDRSKPELSSLDPATPGILWNAGVENAICTDHPETPIQYLSLCAAVAEAEGLSFHHALEAITIVPAKLFGLEDRVGSLKPGKQADLLLFDNDPFGVCVRPVKIWVNGLEVKA